MNWVKEIQRLLGLVVDGVFGQVTKETIVEKVKDPNYQVPEDKKPDHVPITKYPFEYSKIPYHVKDGWLYKGNQQVSQKHSPNVGGDIEPTLVVIHYTGDNDLAGLNWLCNPESNVSAHLWISKEGKIIQLVNFERKAWHAGVSSWDGYQVGNSVNSFSIGIENQGIGDDWPDKQVQANIDVIKALKEVYDIQGVVGHEDVAPGRKVDPGPEFPWDKVNSSV